LEYFIEASGTHRLRRGHFVMIDGWELSMLSIKSQSLLQFDPAVALTDVSFGRYSAHVHRDMAQKTGACLPRQFTSAKRGATLC